MDLFLQQLCNGLVIGSTYAVVAVGFALAFTVLRVIQFAHPDVFMIGMFSGMVAANAVPGGGLLVGLVGGALGGVVSGAAVERLVIAPLRGRDVLTTLIATLGVSIILQNGMAVLVGPDPVPYPRLLPAKFFEIGPVLVTLRQLFNLGLSLVLLAAASFYVRGDPHRPGHPGHRRAAGRRGRVRRRHRRVCRITIWLASGMGGIAAVAVGTLYGSASAFVGLLYGLKAFVCMLVAGNRYFEAVIAVGLALGVLGGAGHRLRLFLDA